MDDKDSTNWQHIEWIDTVYITHLRTDQKKSFKALSRQAIYWCRKVLGCSWCRQVVNPVRLYSGVNLLRGMFLSEEVAWCSTSSADNRKDQTEITSKTSSGHSQDHEDVPKSERTKRNSSTHVTFSKHVLVATYNQESSSDGDANIGEDADGGNKDDGDDGDNGGQDDDQGPGNPDAANEGHSSIQDPLTKKRLELQDDKSWKDLHQQGRKEFQARWEPKLNLKGCEIENGNKIEAEQKEDDESWEMVELPTKVSV